MQLATKIWIALGGVVTVGLVGLGIWEETKSPASVPNQLVSGHRYVLTFSCPTPITAPTKVGVPGTTVVSISPQGQTSAATWTIVFDYVGPTLNLPPIQSGGATACSTHLTDQGLTPAQPKTGTVRASWFISSSSPVTFTVTQASGGAAWAASAAVLQAKINPKASTPLEQVSPPTLLVSAFSSTPTRLQFTVSAASQTQQTLTRTTLLAAVGGTNPTITSS